MNMADVLELLAQQGMHGKLEATFQNDSYRVDVEGGVSPGMEEVLDLKVKVTDLFAVQARMDADDAAFWERGEDELLAQQEASLETRSSSGEQQKTISDVLKANLAEEENRE